MRVCKRHVGRWAVTDLCKAVMVAGARIRSRERDELLLLLSFFAVRIVHYKIEKFMNFDINVIFFQSYNSYLELLKPRTRNAFRYNTYIA